MRSFYNYFGLTVDYCNKDFVVNFRNIYIEEKERPECFECYKADIVYGGST